jgi:hypothetical protein
MATESVGATLFPGIPPWHAALNFGQRAAGRPRATALVRPECLQASRRASAREQRPQGGESSAGGRRGWRSRPRRRPRSAPAASSTAGSSTGARHGGAARLPRILAIFPLPAGDRRTIQTLAGYAGRPLGSANRLLRTQRRGLLCRWRQPGLAGCPPSGRRSVPAPTRTVWPGARGVRPSACPGGALAALINPRNPAKLS